MRDDSKGGQHPRSWLPVALLGVAVLGVLTFVSQGLWGMSRLTAAGFFVVLGCLLAAISIHIDILLFGRASYTRAFSLPSVACAGILTLLLAIQPDVDIISRGSIDLLPRVQGMSRPEIPLWTPESEQDGPVIPALKPMRSEKNPRSRPTRTSLLPQSRPGPVSPDLQTNVSGPGGTSSGLGTGIPGMNGGASETTGGTTS